MRKMDAAAIAVNAAGIADALRVLAGSESNGAARLEQLTRDHEGWCGMVLRIAEAGEIMERFRTKHREFAKWGSDLPHLYEVWDSIAQGLYEHLGTEPLESIVQGAIDEAVSVRTA